MNFSETWSNLEQELSETKYQLRSRLHPFVSAAMKNPVLERMFPFTSLDDLQLAASDNYPSDRPIFCIELIPERGFYFALLTLMHDGDTMPVDFTAHIIDLLNERCRFLNWSEQAHFVLDANDKIVEVIDNYAGIEWIIEQSRGWYSIYQIAAGGRQLLKTASASEAVDYLAQIISIDAQSRTTS